MKRLARHLFTFSSAVSLVLCIAACVLWVRSHSPYSQYDTYQRNSSAVEQRAGGMVFCSSGRTLAAASGGVRLSLTYAEQPPLPASSTSFAQPRPWSTNVEWANAAGMRYPLTPKGDMPPGVKTHFTRAGIQLIAADYNGPDAFGQPVVQRELSVTTPFWLLVLLALVLPACWFAARRRRVRTARLGLCPNCGYDLRASPDRCPECGAAVPPAAV